MARVAADAQPVTFASALAAAPEGVVIVTGFGAYKPGDWQALDLLRSRLRSDATVVLVLPAAGLNHLESAAPNLAAWIGAAYAWDPCADELSDAEP